MRTEVGRGLKEKEKSNKREDREKLDLFHFELMECVPAPQLFSIVRLLLLSSGGAGREEGKEKEIEKWPCILVCVCACVW